MNAKSDSTQSGEPRPALSPAPRKRLRVRKLEDRIAPKKVPKGGRTTGDGTGSGTY